MKRYKLKLGDCLEVMQTIKDNGVDSIICDPPYGLSFMSANWDRGIPGIPYWKETLRIAKPGSHLLAFGGTRTHHRLMVAIEDAGWEIKDTVMWLYGTGFNKHKYLLKPAWEPIVLARKSISESSIETNIARWGTGAININECRIEANNRPLLILDAKNTQNNVYAGRMDNSLMGGSKAVGSTNLGRWPTNLLLDEESAVLLDKQSGELKPGGSRANRQTGQIFVHGGAHTQYDNGGGASRFFYCAKSSKRERGEGNDWPTVKPLSLMRYLCRLITPPNGIVVDPFMGSASTGVAALEEGFLFYGIDSNEHAFEIATKRITEAMGRLQDASSNSRGESAGEST